MSSSHAFHSGAAAVGATSCAMRKAHCCSYQNAIDGPYTRIDATLRLHHYTSRPRKHDEVRVRREYAELYVCCIEFLATLRGTDVAHTVALVAQVNVSPFCGYTPSFIAYTSSISHD